MCWNTTTDTKVHFLFNGRYIQCEHPYSFKNVIWPRIVVTTSRNDRVARGSRACTVVFSVISGKSVFSGTRPSREEDELARKTNANELFIFFFPFFRKISLAPPLQVWFVKDRVVGYTRPGNAGDKSEARRRRPMCSGRTWRAASTQFRAFARQRQGSGGDTRAGPLYACGRRGIEGGRTDGAYTGCVFSTSQSIFSKLYARSRGYPPG